MYDTDVLTVKNFAEKWDFKHTPSSPGNSKANGKAESGVKTAKSLQALDSDRDPYMAILDHRNAPTQEMVDELKKGS